MQFTTVRNLSKVLVQLDSSDMAEACWLPAAAPELPTAMQAYPPAPYPCSVFVQQTCRGDSVLATKKMAC